MFSIAICDDDRKICSYLECIVKEYFDISKKPFCMNIYFSGEKMIEAMKSGLYFDLIFLDIQLEALDGVDAGRCIRDELGKNLIEIVYISSEDSYWRELFEIKPQNFLSKPLEREKIFSEIRKALKNSVLYNTTFTYKQGFNICKIDVKDILFFESLLRKVRMVTIRDEVVFYMKFGEVYDLLKDSDFFHITRSYIINFHHIRLFGHDRVVMSNGTELPISHTYRDSAKKMLLQHEVEKKRR